MAGVAPLLHAVQPLLGFRVIVRHGAINEQEMTGRPQNARRFLHEFLRRTEVVRGHAHRDQVEEPIGKGHLDQSSARSPCGAIFTSLGSNWPRIVTRSSWAAITLWMFLYTIGTSSRPAEMSVTPLRSISSFGSYFAEPPAGSTAFEEMVGTKGAALVGEVAKQVLWRVQLVNWRVLLVTNL